MICLKISAGAAWQIGNKLWARTWSYPTGSRRMHLEAFKTLTGSLVQCVWTKNLGPTDILRMDGKWKSALTSSLDELLLNFLCELSWLGSLLQDSLHCKSTVFQRRGNLFNTLQTSLHSLCLPSPPPAMGPLSKWENEVGVRYHPQPLLCIQPSPLNHVCTTLVSCSDQIIRFAKCHKAESAWKALSGFKWRRLWQWNSDRNREWSL